MRQPLIPIFIAFDDHYAPFGACVIKSALLAKSERYGFAFHVLHEGLGAPARQRLDELMAAHPGNELHFVDVSDYFAAMELHVHTIYNRAIYYRLAIPDLLPQAERALGLLPQMLELAGRNRYWMPDQIGRAPGGARV